MIVLVSAKDVYVCELCGREFNDSTPFPDNCECGNYHEDYFRLKDIHDYEDDLRGVPLFGVTYAPKVSKQRDKRLAKLVTDAEFIDSEIVHPQFIFTEEEINVEESTVITIDSDQEEKDIVIDYSPWTKKQLRALLKEHNHKAANQNLNKDGLLKAVNEVMTKQQDTDTLW